MQVTPNYIASGGDGYKFETWKTRDRILGALDTEVRFVSCSAVDTDIIWSGIFNSAEVFFLFVDVEYSLHRCCKAFWPGRVQSARKWRAGLFW